jgi:hypothetical protein
VAIWGGLYLYSQASTTKNNTAISTVTSDTTTSSIQTRFFSKGTSKLNIQPSYSPTPTPTAPSPCTENFLEPRTVNGTTYCALKVPYFNQNLNAEGIYTNEQTNTVNVAYMCTAASEVMIAGYYNKVSFTNTDELREHMYSSLSSKGLTKGNTVYVDDTPITLCIDGAFGLTSFDPDTGVSECNWNNNVEYYPEYLGLTIQQADFSFDNIVSEINKGHAMLLSISPYDQTAGDIYESHFVVVKGYSLDGQKLLLNDPFRDLNVKTVDGLCGGLSLSAQLDGENSVYDINNPECSVANAIWSIY